MLTKQFSLLESSQVPWVSWDNTKMVSLSESCSLRWCSPV